jgi:type II secretory pathway pseudopilin PulG
LSEAISKFLPYHNRRLRQKRFANGFTLVEILTVIGIIVILIGMLFAAFKYTRNSAAMARTKAQLDTLRGMLGELDAANHFAASPPVWVWYDSPPTPPPAGAAPFPLVSGSGFSTYSPTVWSTSSGNYTADFWKYPFSLVNNGGSPAWDALDAPGDVGDDGNAQQTIQRNVSCSILNTQLAMQMLATVPANKAAIDKLPADSKMMLTWNGSAPLQATLSGSTFAGLLKEDGSDVAMATQPNYVQGVHVTYQGRNYACVATPTTAAPVVNGATPWYDETANSRGVPVLIDGWGNPIIYVPATGLHVKLLNGQSSYLASDPAAGTATQEFIIISPEGSVSGNGSANPFVTRPGRPFFASAGPDGDFTKGDDNLYSFNN